MDDKRCNIIHKTHSIFLDTLVRFRIANATKISPQESQVIIDYLDD